MTNRSDPGLIKRLNFFVAATAVFSVVVGLSALAGLVLHIESLATWGAPAAMMPNTAGCFVLIGVALWLLRKRDNPFAPSRKVVARTLATIVGMVGALSLAEHLFGRGFGIDQFLLAAPSPMEAASATPGLMSPITAGALLLLALALLGIDWGTRRFRWLALYLALSAGTAATFGILSLVFDPHTGVSHFMPALPTMVNLIVFPLGLVCSRTEWGLGELFCRRSPGGILARRLLPVVFVPVLVGWIRWQVTAAGLYSEWNAVVLSSLATMSLLAGIIVWAAVAVDREQEDRGQVDAAPRVGEEPLSPLSDQLLESPALGSLRRKVARGAVVVLALTSVLGVLSWRNVHRAELNADWVAHTHEVLTTLQATLGYLMAVETGAHDFALSGNESVLQPYETGRRAIGPNLDALRRLTGDNPGQQRQLEVLGPQLTAKVEVSDGLVAVRRQTGTAPTAQQLDHAKKLLNAAQTTIQQMQFEEERLLDLRSRKTRAAWRLTIAVLILDSALGVGFLIMAGISIYRQVGVSTQTIARWRQTLKAQTLMRESEARYRGLLEAAPDGMVVVNAGGEIVLLNLQAKKQFGYRDDELVGQKVKNIIPEGFAERLIADGTRSSADALAQQIGAGVELTGRRKDGSEFPIEIMLSPLESAEGVLVTAAIRDISVRKEAEKRLAQMEERRRLGEDALRESEERYRLLLDGVRSYAIFMMDPHGQVVSWNSGAERIKGYRADEIIGHNFSCFYSPEDIERGRPEHVLRMTAASGRHEEQGMRVRKDGSRFLANLVFTALRDPAGNLRGFSEFSHDLSESTASEARYRGLLEAAPDAMVVVKPDGGIVLLNVQAEKQFGYSRDELLGQQVKNLIPEGFAERLIADSTRTAADALAQQIGTGIELTGRRKDGSEFPIEIMLSPLESAEGILVTAAIRDISARKKSEEQLVKTVGELKRSNDELEQFAYVASHDLQEPLRMVASYTQLLAKRYRGRLDSDADEFIAFAVDGCNRMQGLIQDLLAYSRAGTGGKALYEISGEDALKGALANLRATIAQSDAVVTHSALPAIRMDETQLAQIFQNLVGNAIKYRSAEVPHVHVSATKNGGNEWLFSVRDNGLGIDHQYFDRIFVLFQRLHGRGEFDGTGIGLAVCKKIIERVGGRIWVESQPGKGSTFYFALPAGDQK